MKQLSIDVFQIDELSDSAKRTALQKHADINLDYEWWGSTFEFFIELCSTIGLTVNPEKIYFKGFSNQGDGSSFEASVNARQLLAALPNKPWLQDYPFVELNISPCPTDARIIDLIQRGSIDLSVSVAPYNRGYDIRLSFDYSIHRSTYNKNYIELQLSITEDWLEDVVDKLNHFLYRSLSDENDDRSSQESILETIRANEYWFTSDGKLATRLELLASNATASQA